MSSDIYQLATDAEAMLTDIAFSERTQMVVSALRAIEVLPIKRSEQHSLLHNRFAAMFVLALDKNDGLITLDHSSSAYNSRHGLPSQTYRMIGQLQQAGFLTKVGTNAWTMSLLFRKIAGQLSAQELINAA